MRSIPVARRYVFRCSAEEAGSQSGDDAAATAAASVAASREPGGLLASSSPPPVAATSMSVEAAPVSVECSLVWRFQTVGEAVDP